MNISVDNIPIPIFLTDLDGNLIYFNDRLKQDPVLKYLVKSIKIDEFISAFDFIVPVKDHSDVININRTRVNVMINSDFYRSQVGSHVPVDADPVQINVDSVQIDADANTLIFYIENTDKYFEIKNTFMANLSHEIRSPLFGIVGVTSLIQDTNLDQEQLGYKIGRASCRERVCVPV